MREQRWRSIASSIKIAIKRGDLGSGARIASETDMATLWNVSPMTVHRALTELQREGWVVRRPRVGTLVAERNTHPLTRVGLLFPTLSDQPQADYLTGIEDTFGDGYQFVPFRTLDRNMPEAHCIERAESECDAVICYASGDPANTPHLNRLARHMPVVFVDRLPEGVEADVVATDNEGSMLQGLGYLRARGHERIAYIMEDRMNISAIAERRAGYVRFMNESGVPDPLRWLHCLDATIPREVYRQRVETIMIEMLSSNEPITAIACQQAVTMGAVVEACMHLGLELPVDLAVLGFNDHSPGHQALASHTYRLVQRSVEIGHIAAKRIEQRLTNAGIPPQQTRIMADFFPAQPYQPSKGAQEFRQTRFNAEIAKREWS